VHALMPFIDQSNCVCIRRICSQSFHVYDVCSVTCTPSLMKTEQLLTNFKCLNVHLAVGFCIWLCVSRPLFIAFGMCKLREERKKAKVNKKKN
jgi:hypothetical protein